MKHRLPKSCKNKHFKTVFSVDKLQEIFIINIQNDRIRKKHFCINCNQTCLSTQEYVHTQYSKNFPRKKYVCFRLDCLMQLMVFLCRQHYVYTVTSANHWQYTGNISSRYFVNSEQHFFENLEKCSWIYAVVVIMVTYRNTYMAAKDYHYLYPCPNNFSTFSRLFLHQLHNLPLANCATGKARVKESHYLCSCFSLRESMLHFQSDHLMLHV